MATETNSLRGPARVPNHDSRFPLPEFSAPLPARSTARTEGRVTESSSSNTLPAPAGAISSRLGVSPAGAERGT